MQTENEAYVVLLCSHLSDMIAKLRALPAEKWDWTPALPAPSARMVAEHALEWLLTDRQHLEQPDITLHRPIPELPTDPEAFCAALEAERTFWSGALRALTPEQFLEERFQFGIGPQDVRSLVVHITQQTIYKNGQLSTLFFALGLDGEEVYTAPHPNRFYGDLDTMLASPIYKAILQDDRDALRSALEQEDAVQVTAVAGHAPLQVAAMRNRPALVSLLLEHGADANVVDEEGNTPLLYAAAFGYTEVARALLQHGADPHRANNWNAAPLQVARGRKHPEIVTLLEEAEAMQEQKEG